MVTIAIHFGNTWAVLVTLIPGIWTAWIHKERLTSSLVVETLMDITFMHTDLKQETRLSQVLQAIRKAYRPSLVAGVICAPITMAPFFAYSQESEGESAEETEVIEVRVRSYRSFRPRFGCTPAMESACCGSVRPDRIARR